MTTENPTQRATDAHLLKQMRFLMAMLNEACTTDKQHDVALPLQKAIAELSDKT